ncbi:MAG: DUF2062 domain-containing protein [Synechococcales cyanobacterium T60_A2020_003]|nr:DUF2062 domain-containing protein [Synechococcales cyanobacterium T60_A2020_003]
MRFSETPSSYSSSRPISQRRATSWLRTFRYFYHRFTRMEGSPHAIARGLAVGVFSGWFPWFGVQMIIAVALAALVRGNKIMAAASTWVSNPLTYVPIYAFNFHVGCWILGIDMGKDIFTEMSSWSDAVALGQDFLLVLLFGCFVVGLGVAALSYGAGLWLLQSVRQQRLDRRRLQ